MKIHKNDTALVVTDPQNDDAVKAMR